MYSLQRIYVSEISNSGDNRRVFDIFFIIKSKRSEHAKCSSITIPRDVVFLTCFITSLLIKILMSNLGFFFFGYKKMSLVFLAIIDSLLAFNQLVILFISI